MRPPMPAQVRQRLIQRGDRKRRCLTTTPSCLQREHLPWLAENQKRRFSMIGLSETFIHRTYTPRTAPTMPERSRAQTIAA
jgi:hypothetical protein